MPDPIYLDSNATTPIAPEVLEAMVPALRDLWGNPSSAHPIGRRARAAIDRAREELASLIGAQTDEVIFNSGGTEADNAAIFGVAGALSSRGRHIVISAVEHAAVDLPCRELESRGFSVTRIGVDRHGRVDPEQFEAAFRPDTVLVSVIHAQNETGVLQPVAEIARRARTRGIVVHSDTAQSVGKIAVTVDGLGVDLLTVAGHKFYGPKGVGALYLRRETPFQRVLLGAPHESRRRAGTENVAGIVGLGAAASLAEYEQAAREAHLREMRDRLARRLEESIGPIVIHGGAVERLPNTLSVALPGVPAVGLLERLSGVATAAGPACHSGRPEPSQVLLAMGIDEELALATIRLTVSRETTATEIDEAARRIAAAARPGTRAGA